MSQNIDLKIADFLNFNKEPFKNKEDCEEFIKNTNHETLYRNLMYYKSHPFFNDALQLHVNLQNDLFTSHYPFWYKHLLELAYNLTYFKVDKLPSPVYTEKKRELVRLEELDDIKKLLESNDPVIYYRLVYFRLVSILIYLYTTSFTDQIGDMYNVLLAPESDNGKSVESMYHNVDSTTKCSWSVDPDTTPEFHDCIDSFTRMSVLDKKEDLNEQQALDILNELIEFLHAITLNVEEVKVEEEAKVEEEVDVEDVD
jgi:hypothetical protein